MSDKFAERYRHVASKIEGRIACDEPAGVLLQETVAEFPGDYIEIGTLYGGTAILAAMACTGDVYAIDPMDGYYQTGRRDSAAQMIPSIQIFERNLTTFGVNVTLFPHKHPPWPGALANHYFGVGFIDGDHTYEGARADYLALRNRCDCIIFDNTEKPEVLKAATEAEEDGWNVLEHLEYTHKTGRHRPLSMTIMTLDDGLMLGTTEDDDG